MKTINIQKSLIKVDTTKKFNKQLQKLFKQGKNIEELINIVETLANKKNFTKNIKTIN